MEAIYILAFVSIALAAIYYYLTSSFGHWEKQGVPTVRGIIPGIGNLSSLLLMRRNFAEMYRDFYNQTPDHSMVGFYNMRQPGLLIKDPELVRSVMQLNFPHFGDNEFTLDVDLDPLIIANPFFLKGERWKNARKQFSPAFSTGKIKAMYSIIDIVQGKLSNYLKQNTARGNGSIEIETKSLMSRYTAEIVANVAFSAEGGALKGDDHGPFREVGRLMFEPTLSKGIAQLITFFVPAFRRLFKANFMPVEVQKFFIKVVGDMLKYRETENVKDNDFLQFLIQLKESKARDYVFETEFNNHTITSHVSSFFLDVYETASITLSFIMWDIARHPDIQQRLREEGKIVLEKHNGLCYEALQELPYLEKVIRESMRMHPALAALARVCTIEADIEGSDGIKCHVTPGTPVVIPVNALQMDPKYWPEPEKFDPERFSEENKQDRHKFVWLSFGEGPRVCVGMKFALLLMKAAIVTMLQDFSLEPLPRTKQPLVIDPTYFLSSVVGGLWVKVTKL